MKSYELPLTSRIELRCDKVFKAAVLEYCKANRITASSLIHSLLADKINYKPIEFKPHSPFVPTPPVANTQIDIDVNREPDTLNAIDYGPDVSIDDFVAEVMRDAARPT